MTITISKQRMACLFSVLLLSAWIGGPASATVDLLKVYKKTYPDVAPKCLHCHTDAKPKKEDGMHDLNPYGEMMAGKLKEAKDMAEPNEEFIKGLGRHDEYVPEAEEAGAVEKEAVQE